MGLAIANLATGCTSWPATPTNCRRRHLAAPLTSHFLAVKGPMNTQSLRGLQPRPQRRYSSSGGAVRVLFGNTRRRAKASKP
jgi:hypothetical protein